MDDDAAEEEAGALQLLRHAQKAASLAELEAQQERVTQLEEQLAEVLDLVRKQKQGKQEHAEEKNAIEQWDTIRSEVRARLQELEENRSF